MKITILIENQIAYRAARTCSAEWGLSFFIEYNGVNILFDSGHSGAFAINARHLGIDLEKTDFVVLSHHHWDHAGGLQQYRFSSPKNLVLHPDVLNKLPEKQAAAFRKDYHIRASATPVEIAKNLFFLGEIPRVTRFEKGLYKNKPIPDDTALAVKTDKG